MTHARRRDAPKLLVAAGVLVAASVLSGCSSPAATFDGAIEQGIAAVETATLAVDLELDGRTFATTTTTALGDARRELVDASNSVAETDATNTTDAALRADLLDALTEGIAAVNDARDAMAGFGSLEEAEAPLEEAADALKALEGRVAPAANGGRR
ncbi:MAG TPA: hypothetical protein VFG92_02265 [Agromyces sp.]|nr:hypothetical protein [Agromyces sp.]